MYDHLGFQGDSASMGACYIVWIPEFHPKNQDRRGKLTPESLPVIS